MKYSRKKYDSLADALDLIPATAEEYEKQVQEELENSLISEKEKTEQPEPTNKYEIRFVKKPKKQKQKPIQKKKITNSEEFSKAFREGLKKKGLLDKLIETPSQPTNEYTAVLRPFKRRHQKFYVPLSLSADEALKRVKAFYGIGEK